MSSGTFILIYVVTLMLVVVVHEAGHFTAAKIFRIKVEEFFVGFGPRVWSFRRGETEYGLKALPLGGYVRIAGMNPFQETPEEEVPRTFGAKPAWQRAAVIGAGPVTHFVIAIVLLAVYFGAIGVATYRPMIDQVCAIAPKSGSQCPAKGKPSPAQLAGFHTGDVVVSVDGHRNISEDSLHRYTGVRIGVPMTFVVRRHGELVTLHATPRAALQGGKRVGRLG